MQILGFGGVGEVRSGGGIPLGGEGGGVGVRGPGSYIHIPMSWYRFVPPQTHGPHGHHAPNASNFGLQGKGQHQRGAHHRNSLPRCCAVASAKLRRKGETIMALWHGETIRLYDGFTNGYQVLKVTIPGVNSGVNLLELFFLLLFVLPWVLYHDLRWVYIHKISIYKFYVVSHDMVFIMALWWLYHGFYDGDFLIGFCFGWETLMEFLRNSENYGIFLVIWLVVEPPTPSWKNDGVSSSVGMMTFHSQDDGKIYGKIYGNWLVIHGNWLAINPNTAILVTDWSLRFNIFQPLLSSHELSNSPVHC